MKNGNFRCTHSDQKIFRMITTFSCNVNLQLSAVMSNICFDFFFSVVLTFEEEGWNKLNIIRICNFKIFWMDQGKDPFVDLCKVKKYTKLLTRTRLWTWNTQKEVSVEITSTYEDLRRIWWAIAQGNISFFVSYYVWTNFTSQLYFWLRFVRISFTLYGF